MAEQEKTSIPKKRRGPAPTGQGTPVMVRIHPELLEWVDAEREQVAQTRPEFVRQMLEERMKVVIEEPPSDEQQAAADPAAPIDPDQLPPAWIRKAAARFLLWGARLIRNRPGSNAIRLAQADFYERLAEIALDGSLPPKPLPKQD